MQTLEAMNQHGPILLLADIFADLDHRNMVGLGKIESFVIFHRIMDVHSPRTRSYNMSRIKGKNTKPEMIVRRYLHSRGYRYGLHNSKLPGKPDLVLAKHNTVVFVHGCFWHGHSGCKYFVIPKTRRQWWLMKILRNKTNDRRKSIALKRNGWKVVTVWECQLRRTRKEKTLKTIESSIES